jgi:peptidoglycan/LPS O-acetylase OafA/YrhL
MSSEGPGLLQSKGFTSLDVLRTCAALMVAIPHWFVFSGSHPPMLEFLSIYAVEIFFILSGYVLSAQLSRCMEDGSGRNLVVFYLRRWIRTIPPYVVMLGLTGVAAGVLVSAETIEYLFFVKNLYAVADAGDYYVVAWSLAIEEWFYLLFPVLGVAGRLVGWGYLRTTIALLVLMLVAKTVYWMVAADPLDMRRIVVLRLDSIAVGFLLAKVIHDQASAHRLRWWFAAGTMVFLPVTYHAFINQASLLFVYAAGISAASLLSWMLAYEPLFARFIRVRKGAAAGANLSYTIYLSHPVLFLVTSGWMASATWSFLLYLLLVVLVGICMFVFVEAPLLALRPRYARDPQETNWLWPGVLRTARLVVINLLVALVLVVAVELGSMAALGVYQQASDWWRTDSTVRPQTDMGLRDRASDSDQTSNYSSAGVPRDLNAYQDLPGSAYAYESFVVFKQRQFHSEFVNVDGAGQRLNRAAPARPAGVEPPVELARPADKVVWVVGSSPVFGATNADTETIPSYMERALDRASPGTTHRVHNLGVVGYTSWQQVSHLRMRLAAAQRLPDLVVFFNGMNDYYAGWESIDKDCAAMLETGVGTSALHESWRGVTNRELLRWSLMDQISRTWLPNLSEVLRLADKAIVTVQTRSNLQEWKRSYRSRRDAQRAVAQICVPRATDAYLLNMRSAAGLLDGLGINSLIVAQPNLYATTKPLTGNEKQEFEHSLVQSFAVTDAQLDAMVSVPSFRVTQNKLRELGRFLDGYDDQKQRLKRLAAEVNARYLDPQSQVDGAGAVAIYSSTIHFTFRGARLLGEQLAAEALMILASPDRRQ